MILKFDLFKPYKDTLVHGMATKMSDHPEELIFANQVHGDKIIAINKKPEDVPDGDAFITNQKNLSIAVRVADCQGLLVFDPVQKAISAIHSGWRGSTVNIIGKTIQRLKEEYGSNPKDLIVGISPSLGPCCTEFSDPKKELPEFIHPYIEGHHVDFWSLSIDQLKNEGVMESQIEKTKQCTKCDPAGFYSYRKGDAGRMAVFISLI